MIPPFSERWMRLKRTPEEFFQQGKLPQGGASAVFKVPNKAAGQMLLTKVWVTGNKFRVLAYIPDKADTMCGICSQWGHSEFRWYAVSVRATTERRGASGRLRRAEKLERCARTPQ